MKREDLPCGDALMADVTDVVDKRELVATPPATSTALVVTPHPLTTRGQQVLSTVQAPLQPGDTLAAFVARHGVLPDQQWVVSIGGADVPELMWQRVRPKPGHIIECRRAPGEDALKLVAVVALAYFTFGAGGMAGGSFLGMTGVTGYVAAGAAYMAGSMVINKLLGPKSIDAASGGSGRAVNSESPSYSLTGGKNRMRPFEPMGLVLGEPYAVPDMAAQPYTYFANAEQYLWQLFHCGINCAEISSIRIGQTPIENYQDVTLTRDGFASGNTGLPALGTNVDSIAGALLDAPTGPGAWVTRTSSVNTITLAVDIVASLYKVNSSTGAYEAQTLNHSVEYRQVGTSTWLPFIWNSGASFPLECARTKPLRITWMKPVTAGQYEVRARKDDANITTSDAQNTLEWSTLKSYQADNANYSGQSRLGIQVQASGQLNGALDEVNAVLRAKPMPVWDGSAWATATTRDNGLSNPGAILLLLARGIYDASGRLLAGLGFADSQIDLDSIKGFTLFCTAKSFKFDWFVQETCSIGDLMDTVAAAGLGAVAWPDGKLGVIWFTDNQPIQVVINMGTIKSKSFSVEYDTGPTADEIEFQYFDRTRGNTWKSLRVQAPGVTTPTTTGRTQLQGVTDEAQAAILARFSMAQNVYQRKTVTCEVDLEHMTFQRGTVLALSHDITQWGYGGRVQAASNSSGIVTLTLDDLVPAVSPTGATSRYIGLRIPGEAQYRIFPVASFTGSSRTVSLATAWPGGVPVPGDSAGNPAHDTVWIYDFKATPGQKLRVAGCVPQGNMAGARVSLVPETDEFWTYVWTGSYTPPPNTSLLSQTAPVITSASVTEQLYRQGTSFYTELSLSFNISGRFDMAEVWGSTSGGALQKIGETRNLSCSWRGGLNEVWALEIRAYSGLRRLAARPYRLTYAIAGLKTPPADIHSFTIDGDRFKWSGEEPLDFDGDQIRFHYGQNTWWPSATPLHLGLLTSSPWTMTTRPAGRVTFMVKQFDTSGNESINPAVITVNLGDTPVDNVLITWPQAPLFGGTITGGAVSAGVLQATATDLFYGPPDEPFYGPDTDPFYSLSTYAELVYEFSVTVTDGQAGTLTLQHAINAGRYTIEYLRDSQDSFYGDPHDLFYGPPGDPFYGPPGQWATWPGSIEITDLEIIRFRVTTAAGDTRGEITALTPLIDVPDVTESLNDIVIAAGGTRLPITKTYREITNLARIAVQDDGNGGVGVRIKDKNPTLGPLVAVVNGAGTEVAGLVDAEPQGY